LCCGHCQWEIDWLFNAVFLSYSWLFWSDQSYCVHFIYIPLFITTLFPHLMIFCYSITIDLLHSVLKFTFGDHIHWWWCIDIIYSISTFVTTHSFSLIIHWLTIIYIPLCCWHLHSLFSHWWLLIPHSILITLYGIHSFHSLTLPFWFTFWYIVFIVSSLLTFDWFWFVLHYICYIYHIHIPFLLHSFFWKPFHLLIPMTPHLHLPFIWFIIAFISIPYIHLSSSSTSSIYILRALPTFSHSWYCRCIASWFHSFWPYHLPLFHVDTFTIVTTFILHLLRSLICWWCSRFLIRFVYIHSTCIPTTHSTVHSRYTIMGSDLPIYTIDSLLTYHCYCDIYLFILMTIHSVDDTFNSRYSIFIGIDTLFWYISLLWYRYSIPHSYIPFFDALSFGDLEIPLPLFIERYDTSTHTIPFVVVDDLPFDPYSFWYILLTPFIVDTIPTMKWWREVMIMMTKKRIEVMKWNKWMKKMMTMKSNGMKANDDEIIQ